MPDSIKCDNFVSNMEKYLPMIADERYGCILYGGEEILKRVLEVFDKCGVEMIPGYI